jgi:hypothetical protein
MRRLLAGLGLALVGGWAMLAASAAQPPVPHRPATTPVCDWNLVTSPDPRATINYLTSMAAVSADDIWAVGFYGPGSGDQTLIEHWDGTAWSVVPSPSPGTDNYLQGVAVVAANDVWAVGYSHTGNLWPTLILHWNGTAWSQVPSPGPGTANFLRGITVVAANDLWAAGYISAPTAQTLVLHWEGSTWTQVASPSPGTGNNYLYGIAARAANDIWAVGWASQYDSGPGYPRERARAQPTAKQAANHVTGD